MSLNEKPIEYNFAVEAYILLSAFVREGKVVPELYDKEKVKAFVLYLSRMLDSDPIVLDFVRSREQEVKDFKPVEVKEEINEIFDKGV